MVRNGSRSVRYLDLRGSVLVKTDAVLQRYLCPRCGGVDEIDGPVLARGYRMTRPALTHVAALATIHPITTASTMSGLDRGTVRRIWTEWADALSRHVPSQTVLAWSVDDLVLLLAPDGGLLGVFPREGEDLVRWLSDGGCGMVLHRLTDPVRSTIIEAGIGCAVRRVDMLDWIDRRVPVAVSHVGATLDDGLRRHLPVLSATLASHVNMRTDRDRERLERLAREDGRLVDLVAGVDALRSVFAVANPAIALTRARSWVADRTPLVSTAFGDFVSIVSNEPDVLFGEHYSRHDRSFVRRFDLPPVEEGALIDRRIRRIHAWSHPAVAGLLASAPVGMASTPDEQDVLGPETQENGSSLFEV